MPSFRIYSSLDLRMPDMHPRTELYPIRALGMETPMVESLTSYITRLAQAHDISTRTLIADYLRFRLPQKAQPADALRHHDWSRHFLDYAHTLNGMVDRLEDWVFALEGATGVANLRYLTMIPWRGIFDNRRMLRSRRAWCAFCYQDWRDAGKAIYEPLLWALADVPDCLIHRRALAESCPHCKRKSLVLTPRSCPGCCPHCHHWLGSKERYGPTSGLNSESCNTGVVMAGLARLLADGPSLEQRPLKDITWANLQGCVHDLAGGNTALFARAAGLSACTLVPWFAGRKLPAFASLNGLCYRLGIPLYRFLTERLTAGDPDWENARRIVNHHGERSPASDRGRPVLSRPSPPAACVSDRQIKRALQCALRENPLPTIRQIAWRHGISRARIYTHFPGFHKILSAAQQDQIEAAAKAALLESPPPTLRDLQKRGVSRATLHACFPSLYRRFALCSAQRHRRKREGRKLALEVARAEEPPPSGHVLAARLRTSRGTLAKTFPDIWGTIVQRHTEYQKRETSKKRAAFAERVRRIVTDLLRIGKYPSRRRVLARMGASDLKGEQLIVNEVQRAVLAFGSKLEA